MNDSHIKESVTSFVFDVFRYAHIQMMGGVFRVVYFDSFGFDNLTGSCMQMLIGEV